MMAYYQRAHIIVSVPTHLIYYSRKYWDSSYVIKAKKLRKLTSAAKDFISVFFQNPRSCPISIPCATAWSRQIPFETYPTSCRFQIFWPFMYLYFMISQRNYLVQILCFYRLFYIFQEGPLVGRNHSPNRAKPVRSHFECRSGSSLSQLVCGKKQRQKERKNKVREPNLCVF